MNAPQFLLRPMHSRRLLRILPLLAFLALAPTAFSIPAFPGAEGGGAKSVGGHGGTVLRSADKDKSWIRQESRTPSHLYGLFMMKKNGWAVGAKGSIIGYQK